jgi:hypothetical protein
MKRYLRNIRFFNILLLIFLAGFLVLPKICLAEDFKNITQEEIGKYLELPAGEVEGLLQSLINVFHEEWINLETSPYSTAEERAIPIIMRQVTRIQALNHLLVDAPIEITGKIIKSTIEITRLFLTKDPSAVLEKFEKESVNKAIEYGEKYLFQNEIRVTPGAVNFKYTSRNGSQKEVIFQYLII